MKTCARPGCALDFTPKTHNQKYCSNECCRIATNDRLKEKYHERRANRMGVKRLCKLCQVTVLSRYNDGSICSGCRYRMEQNNVQVMHRIATVVS